LQEPGARNGIVAKIFIGTAKLKDDEDEVHWDEPVRTARQLALSKENSVDRCQLTPTNISGSAILAQREQRAESEVSDATLFLEAL
jgi:hypothetical protein